MLRELFAIYLDELILNDLGTIDEYVDVNALREVYDRFVSRESREKPQDVFAIWRAVSLALWLRHGDTTLRVVLKERG